MAGFPVFVNIVWDPTLGFNTHKLWPPGSPAPSPAPVPAIEMIATQMWTAGYAVGKNKFTKNTLHLGMPICKGDHDLGPLIPDLTIPPPNLFYAINWPFSSRKMSFKTSTVKMDGDPVGCAELLFLPIPMLTCGDPMTLPLSFPLVNVTHTLTVGMTLADAILGAATAVATAAIDFIFDKIGGGPPGKLGQELLNAALEKVGLSPKELAKRVVSGLVDFGLQVASGEDNPSFKIALGGGIVPEYGIMIGGDPNDPSRVGTTTVGGIPVSGTQPGYDQLGLL